MPCRATQDGSWWRVLTKHGPLEKGMALQYSCLENPMNSMKRQKDRTLKDEHCRLVGAQYATGDQWRNSPRKKLPNGKKQAKARAGCAISISRQSTSMVMTAVMQRGVRRQTSHTAHGRAKAKFILIPLNGNAARFRDLAPQF